MSPMRIIRRPDLRVLFLAGIAAAMATVALGLTLVFRTSQSEQFRRQTAVNCRQVENLKTAITSVLVDGKVTALQRNQDPAIRKAITSYYDRQLERFAPDSCPT